MLLPHSTHQRLLRPLAIPTTANVAGHTKKIITSAFLFLGYSTGNIAGPFFYKTAQSPVYTLGIWSMIVAQLIELVIVGLLREMLRRDNEERSSPGCGVRRRRARRCVVDGVYGFDG